MDWAAFWRDKGEWGALYPELSTYLKTPEWDPRQMFPLRAILQSFGERPGFPEKYKEVFLPLAPVQENPASSSAFSKPREVMLNEYNSKLSLENTRLREENARLRGELEALKGGGA